MGTEPVFVAVKAVQAAEDLIKNRSLRHLGKIMKGHAYADEAIGKELLKDIGQDAVSLRYHDTLKPESFKGFRGWVQRQRALVTIWLHDRLPGIFGPLKAPTHPDLNFKLVAEPYVKTAEEVAKGAKDAAKDVAKDAGEAAKDAGGTAAGTSEAAAGAAGDTAAAGATVPPAATAGAAAPAAAGEAGAGAAADAAAAGKAGGSAVPAGTYVPSPLTVAATELEGMGKTGTLKQVEAHLTAHPELLGKENIMSLNRVLRDALVNNKPGLAKLLLDKSPHLAESYGQNAETILAAARGGPKMLKFLTDRKVSLDVLDGGLPPLQNYLHLSRMGYEPAIVENLVNAGANINALPAVGEVTVLDRALITRGELMESAKKDAASAKPYLEKLDQCIAFLESKGAKRFCDLPKA